MMYPKKVQKVYTDLGFGFPVLIQDAPLRKVQGKWALNLNFEKYERAVLLALALKPSLLTGNEVKFIRNHFEMNLKSFGQRFGNVAHSAVIKWEKTADEFTNMNWSTEKDIRLAIVDTIKPTTLNLTYDKLKKTASKKPHKIKLNTSDLKAS